MDFNLKNVKAHLETVILPFWMNKMIDNTNGGFYGQITGNDVLVPEANKGAILNARILWSFSAAYRVLGNELYLQTAKRAKDYLLKYFLDKKNGGVYWMLDYKGNPIDTKKQIYALGFAIYGLSEYHRATNDQEALDVAKEIFSTIEKHAFDPVYGGYFEAFTSDWQEIEDMRLSDKDANEKKTMNTHLHIIEPYTNLYRVWKDPFLEKQLRGLLQVFTDKIIDKNTGHLNLFFNEKWQVRGKTISYGHDIEASWLLHETALVLGDEDVLKQIEPIIKKIAVAAAEGLQNDGSIVYEFNVEKNHLDKDRHSWCQAETVVGYYNLFKHFADNDALEKALASWRFIEEKLTDNTNGEWYWSIKADGSINRTDDKAGFWKCPYHNSRACLEVIERNMSDE